MRRSDGVFCVALVAVLAGARGVRSEVSPEGLAYYLPRTVINVAVTRTVVDKRVPRPDLTDAKRTRQVDSAFTVEAATVADVDRRYVIQASPSFWKSQSMTVKLSSRGLLAGINSESAGQAGPGIVNIIKGVARLLPLVLALDEDGRSAPPPWPQPVEACEDERPSVEGMSLEKQAFILRSPVGCQLWLRMKESAKAKEEWDVRLRSARARLEKASGDALAQALAVVREHQKQVDALAAAQDALLDQFGKGLKEFVASVGLYSRESTEARVFAFNLDEVPKDADLATLWSAAASATHPQMLELVKWAGIGVSLDALGGAAVGGSNGSDASDDVVIRYRAARPFKLAIWGDVEVAGDRRMRAVRESRVVGVFAAGTDPQTVRLQSSAWSKRALSLQFDADGQPVVMANSSEAKSIAVTSAIAEAGAVAADAYQKSLEQLGEIQKASDALKTQDLESRITELQKQKTLVEADLALAGALSTSDATLRKQQISAELAALEAELSLNKAKSAQDLGLDVAILQAEVGKLKAQLSLLQAQQALEQAK